jgi:hypothetical protein
MAADTDKKDGPNIGGHREPEKPAAWVPAKPTQQEQGPAAAGAAQEAEGAAAEVADTPATAIPGSTTTTTIIDQTTDAKKKLTPKEKLEAGLEGILSGAGGSKEGKLIGEAVGAGIKKLFGQGDNDAAKAGPKVGSSGGTQVGPGRLGPSADAQQGGPVIGAQRQQGAKQEGAGGLDVGGSLGKSVGGMIGSAIGGEKGKTVGQMLGKVAGNAVGQAADMAVDHARGIGGSIGGAIGGVVGGEKGAAVGKDLGKGIGSGVQSVRDTLAGAGVQLGAKQAPGKQSHGVK